MKKYLAGGKAVGSTGCVKEDCSQTNKDFSAMLSAREKQMADLWASPVQQQPSQETPFTQKQIVLHKPVQQVQNNKQVDINTILDGDY
jgi:hypothetical protein